MGRPKDAAEILESLWAELAADLGRRPELLERLEARTARALDDRDELGKLPDDEAEILARLAHAGLGELLYRMVRRPRPARSVRLVEPSRQ